MAKVLPALIGLFVSFGWVGAIVSLPPLLRVTAAQASMQTQKLRIAVKDNLQPLGFRAADGSLQGFEIEIARRLARQLSHNPDALELIPVSNQNRLTAVLNGEADMAIARVTATEMRSRVVVFSVPYYLDGTALVTKDASLRRTWDAARRRIVVLNGSNTLAIVRDRLPQAQLVAVSSYQAAKQVLDQGQADAFAADASVLTGWVKEFPEYQVLSPLISIEPLAIVFPKGVAHDPLRRQVNQLIEQWHVEGWLEEQATQWGLPWQKQLQLEPNRNP
ncbi:MAG TPA: transporter substrate-binding domain-containing protein [Leptolyngbyaceae cyanobacterium M33_DOE_097]|uniref:Transporter substrate-binding domain-containing protein n=1 Tax=Oscillatoriales cyanobacterium SpSt-418 TaxID=2282169 RepID=A0A7C3KBE5_9CYAN|nr:transporter substrate-binding domain-containing protein [Leptolyngbyaceae cyanobacterium M33_DOE_097]